MVISETLPSRIELVPEFTLKAIAKIRSLPFKEEDIFAIRLSLEEALINAIKHGNKFNPALSVQVKIDIGKDCVTLELLDQGKGFDFQSSPEYQSDKDLVKTSGRGIILIRNLMDEVNFYSGGRGIKMKKLLKYKKEAGSEYKRGKA